MSSSSESRTVDDRSGQTTDPTSAATRADAGGLFSPARGSSTTSAAPGSIPSVIGSYRILSILGHGGMGVVYKAEQSQPRRLVALKVIGAGIVSPRLMRRFEHEAELLGRLQHPGIAQIYEAGAADTGRGPQPYFAMELVEGRPLNEHVAANDLGTRHCLELLARVCDAVQYAHQRGVIHRDLKPANILVTGDGQPKVLDFGVARATDSDLTLTSQTDVGQLIGTLPYMSPEQAAGAMGERDTRSDVYSLGVIGYEMIARRPPYELRGRMIHEAVRVIREEEPTRLSSLNRTLRGDVETIIGKALEKEKDRRYASAGDLAADIRRYLSDQPVAARPPTLQYQVRKFARRNPALVTGVCVAFLAMIVGGAFAAVQWRRAVRAERVARQRFNDVRQLARTFMFDVHDKVSPLAGSTPAVRQIVNTSLAYLNRLAADAGNDPGLMRDVADAYLKVGEIQGGMESNNVGDIQGGLESGEKALAIFRQLLARDPTSVDLRERLAVCEAKLGDIQVNRSDVPAAAAHYAAAVVLARELSRDQPQDLSARRNLCSYLMKHSWAQMRTGHIDAALAQRRELVDIAEQLAVRPQAELERYKLTRDLLEGDLRAAYYGLAEVLETTGDANGALAAQRRALAIARGLAERDPDNANYQRALMRAYNRHGQTLAVLYNYDEALDVYQRAIAIARRLVVADPDNVRAREDLSECLQRVGDVQAFLERWDAALASHREGLALEQAMRPKVRTPDDARSLAISYVKLGETLLGSGNPLGAVDPLRRAAELARGQLESDPKGVFFLQIAAHAMNKLGTALTRAGDVDAAVEAQRQSLELAQRWAALDPSNNWAHRQIMFAHGGIADALGSAGREPARGLEPARAALDLARQRLLLQAGNAIAQRDVWDAQRLLGDIHLAAAYNEPDPHLRRTMFEAARAQFDEARRLVREMRDAGSLGSADAPVAEADLGVRLALCDEALAVDGDPSRLPFAPPAPADIAPAPTSSPAPAPTTSAAH